jgi:hypothetical protein
VIVLEPINAAFTKGQSEKSATSKLLFQDSLTCPKANAGSRPHDITLGGESRNLCCFLPRANFGWIESGFPGALA